VYASDDDPLHKKWLENITAQRAEFATVVEHAAQGLAPLRNAYKENYRQFQSYLTTTIDLVEMLPKHVGPSLEFRYTSGFSNHELSTNRWGKQ
jgi:hypothetical protein